MICGLSNSSNCNDFGCMYFRVICWLQSFLNEMIHGCKIHTHVPSAVAELLVSVNVLHKTFPVKDRINFCQWSIFMYFLLTFWVYNTDVKIKESNKVIIIMIIIIIISSNVWQSLACSPPSRTVCVWNSLIEFGIYSFLLSTGIH